MLARPRLARSSRSTVSATTPSSVTTRRARSASCRTCSPATGSGRSSTATCCPTSRPCRTGSPRSRARRRASPRRPSACRPCWRRRAPSGGRSSSAAACSDRRRASPPASPSPPRRSLFAHARVARPDTLLVLLLSLALGCAWRWWRDRQPSSRDRRAGTARPRRDGQGAGGAGPVRGGVRLFLLWQRDLRRVLQLCTPAGITAFVVLGLGWYALAWAGWGDTLRRAAPDRPLRAQPGRRPRAAATPTRRSPGTIISSSTRSTCPRIALAVDPVRRARALAAVAPAEGCAIPRARFLICWAAGAGAGLHAGGVEAALLSSAVPARRWRCSPGRRSCA